jgi:hypothetical protein
MDTRLGGRGGASNQIISAEKQFFYKTDVKFTKAATSLDGSLVVGSGNGVFVFIYLFYFFIKSRIFVSTTIH